MWVLGLASVAWSVKAHAPYERLWATLTDPAGRQLLVVARYTDGIIGADPVTVTVRDASGVAIAETESARDAIVRCPGYASCRVFLYESPYGLRPHKIVRVEPSGFVEETARRYEALGVLLPLWYHFSELAFESLAFALVPVLAQILAWRSRTALTVLAWVLLVPAGLAWIAFLLLVVPLNTLVSVAWIALGVSILVAAPAVIRAALIRGFGNTSRSRAGLAVHE